MRMNRTAYKRLQELAQRVAKTLPVPAFYDRHASAVRFADDHLVTSELLHQCRTYLDESSWSAPMASATANRWPVTREPSS